MTEDGHSRPLPQRERGATEAGANAAPAPASPRALSDDLRQRMQASVDAERAQARERVTEVLRQGPQRLAHGERPAWPPKEVQDRKPAGWRKRRKAERAANSDAPATPAPETNAAIVENEAPVNSAPSEPISPPPPSTAPAPATPAPAEAAPAPAAPAPSPAASVPARTAGTPAKAEQMAA